MILKSIKYLLTSLLLCHQLIINATNNNNDNNFKQKLELVLQHAQKHKSFEVNFTQEVYSALRDKTTQSRGVLKVQAPNSWSFEVQKPRKEFYINNGVDFWKYTPDLKHAQHLNANTLEFDYISLLTKPDKIKEIYKISPWSVEASTGSQEVLSIKLDPKGDNSQKVLYAILNVKTGLLDELQIVQTNGNRVKLLFSGGQDKDFDKKTFSFTPPEGIVVDKN